MDLSQLITANYYLDSNPGGEFLIGFALLAFFIISMFAGRIASNIARGNKYLKKSIRKQFWAFPFLGVLGVIAVLSRFGGIPVFSMRAILYALLLSVILLLTLKILTVNREYKKRLTSAANSKKNNR